MVVEIDGGKVASEWDVHTVLWRGLDFGPYYGYNLDALWDALSANVERPVLVIWLHSDISQVRLGVVFDRIVQVFEKVKQQDLQWGLVERFDYELR